MGQLYFKGSKPFINEEKIEFVVGETCTSEKGFFAISKFVDAVKFYPDINELYIVKLGEIVNFSNPAHPIKAALSKEITFIKKVELTEELIQLAVMSCPVVISYIENPSEEVQRIAVEEHFMALKYIKNPSKEIQKAAVEADPRAVRYIENPSEDIQILAIQKYPIYINDIKNPTKRVVELANKINQER